MTNAISVRHLPELLNLICEVACGDPDSMWNQIACDILLAIFENAAAGPTQSKEPKDRPTQYPTSIFP
jgi:hypothetical protein